MTLSRLVNYVDGNTLTGAQLNNEFDNILNNGPSLVSVSIPAISTVQGLRGSIISNIGSFAAGAYQLRSTSLVCSLSATSSYSINTQTAGPIANGRDQAAAFGSTDVHFYAITTGGTSTNAAGICSSSPPPTGPTLPAGYAAWAYLASAKYSTGSSAVVNSWRISGSQITAPARIILAPTFGTSEVAISLSSQVPPIALQVILDVSMAMTATAVGANAAAIVSVGVESSPALTLYDINLPLGGISEGGTALATRAVPITLPNLGTPLVYARAVVNVGTTATGTVRVTGYSVPNGDVG